MHSPTNRIVILTAQFSLGMDFYRASYTSFDGSITDFIVPVKSGTQTMHEVVLSAFHQLEMLFFTLVIVDMLERFIPENVHLLKIFRLLLFFRMILYNTVITSTA